MNFKIVNELGKEIECEIVGMFKDDNTKRDYIIYTDGTKDDSGKLEVYASRCRKENDTILLEEIQNEAEWDLIDKYLKDIDKR